MSSLGGEHGGHHPCVNVREERAGWHYWLIREAFLEEVDWERGGAGGEAQRIKEADGVEELMTR